MKIQVTAQDIKNGNRRNPYSCPVALALTRHGVCHHGVSCFAIILEGRNWDYTPDVKEFIRRFDLGHEVQPFEFEIDI